MFVDFRVQFGTAQRDVQTMSQIMAKGARTAGMAADAQERMAKSTRRSAQAQRQARDEMGRFRGATKKSTSQVKQFIKTLLGIELARRVIRGLLNTFLGFSQAMNNVRAITNATDEQFARLRATARELGRTTQFTATDAGNALAFLARTGLDVDEAIGVLPSTLNLAAATTVDLATAADLATNILRGMGLEVSDLAEVVDVLALTTNSSNVNILELAEAMKIVAPEAADAGISVQRLSAMIGILGDAGIKGTAAGTALRRSLVNIKTGAGAVGPVLASLGIQIEDAEGNFVGLDEVLRAVEGGLVTDTELFRIFGLRAITAARVLSGAGVMAIDEFEASLDRAAGTAERMRTQQMAGLVGAAKELTSATQELAIAWGEGLAPALIVVANLIKDFVLPTLRGILLVFGAMGPVVSLAVDALVVGVGLMVTSVVQGLGLMTVAVGKGIRNLAELGEEFLPESLLGQASERIATFGSKLELQGIRILANARDRQAGLIDTITTSFNASAEVMGELIDKFNGVVAATEKAAKAVGELADETDNLARVVGVDLPQLDLTEFEAQLGAVREQLRTALSLEADFAFAGAESALAVQRSLSELTESQREKVLGLVDAERDLATVLANIAVIQAELAEAGADVDKQAEATAALVDLMAQLGEKSREVERQLSGVAETGRKGLAEVNREADVTLRVLSRMARALGLLDAGLGGVLRSAAGVVKALGEIQKLQGGGKAATSFFGALSGAGGLAAGAGLLGAGIAAVTTVLGGLFAGNTEADRIRRENTRAIEALTSQMGRMAQVLRQTTGTQFAGFDEALAILRDAVFSGGVQGGPATIRGLTPEQIQILIDAAEALGLTFTGFADNAAQLQEALEAIDFGALTEDFVSAMNVLQQRFAIFDDVFEDPIDQLDAILALFEQFSDIPLPDFNLTTAAGRAALDQFVRDLFDAITGGAFDLAALGTLTTQQALDLLGQIESTLDQIEDDTVDAGEGTTDAFRRSAQITVVQGGRLIAIADTSLFRLTQIRDLIAAGTQPIQPPPPPIGGGGNGGGPGGRETFVLDGDIVVPIQVSVSGSVDDADALAAQLSTAVITRIDEGLEELRIKKRRALGD